MKQTILLSAGGTGGHLFPAQALAQEMITRGWEVHLATDARAERFVSQFPAEDVHIVKSATFAGNSPVALARTLLRLGWGYLSSRRLISKVRPDVVVGFGGYPTVPPLLAAVHKGVPTILHEQNAVMGRANRFLANRVNAIAAGFDITNSSDFASAPITVTGNPLRAVAHEAARHQYIVPTENGPFNLLVFGGSQGARFFSQVLPAALQLLEPPLAFRLRLTLQARPEDAAEARSVFQRLQIEARVDEFFTDLPDQIARSHLVICRSGASSVSELALIGRPSILVPLPGALDDDQGANAARLAETGGGFLERQNELTPEKLSTMLASAMKHPETLAIQAENAKKASVVDAAERLADLVQAHA